MSYLHMYARQYVSRIIQLSYNAINLLFTQIFFLTNNAIEDNSNYIQFCIL